MSIKRNTAWPLIDALRGDVARNRTRTPPALTRREQGFVPSADVYEHADRFLIEADLPGIDPSAVEITLEDGILKLAGERKPAEDVRSGAALRVERALGGFERRFRLPALAVEDGLEASYRNGVLTISIPKAAAAIARRIEVKAA